MKETTEAITESAKAAQKAFDFATAVGKVFGGPGRQIAGILEDQLRYFRFKNGLAILRKAEALLQREGFSTARREVSPKLTLTIMESATLEDEPALQELWAKLVAGLVGGQGPMDVHATYARILHELSPMDAQVLAATYARYLDYVAEVPEVGLEAPTMVAIPTQWLSDDLGADHRDLRVSIDVLIRQRLLQLAPQKNAHVVLARGGPGFPTTDLGYLMVSLTELGRSFMEAVT